MILFGFKSCGKTFWGKRLAERLSWNFIDTDLLLEERENLPVREIYIRFGESYFRSLEKEIILSLKKAENRVIAVGGGAIFDEAIVAHLQSLGKLIYLRQDKAILKKRLLLSPPAYFNLNDNEASFERLYAQRKPLYESIAAYAVDLSIQSDDQVLNLLSEYAL